MELIFNLMNIVCGFILIVYGTCKLGARNYPLQSPELIAHFCLSIGGLSMVLSPFATTGILLKIITLIGVSIYFLHKSIRIMHLQHITKIKQ